MVSGVSFAYGDRRRPPRREPHRSRPASACALVGPTGAGKSTLAKLIVRVLRPARGFRLVRRRRPPRRDAALVARAHRGGARRRGSCSRARSATTSGSAADRRDRRRGGSGGRRARRARAVRVAARRPRHRSARTWSRLSAGERQLVSLARAALADPTVLVLDEATSNLDPGTEHIAERALEVLTERRTVVVVAHRLSTAARADRVAVIDDGDAGGVGYPRRADRARRPLRRVVRVVVGRVGRRCGATARHASDAFAALRPGAARTRSRALRFLRGEPVEDRGHGGDRCPDGRSAG